MKYSKLAIVFIVTLFSSSHATYGADKVNIRTLPSLIINWFDIDIKLGNNLTVGPSYELFLPWGSGYQSESYEIGIRLNYFFNDVFTSGWYVGSKMRYAYSDYPEKPNWRRDLDVGDFVGKVNAVSVGLTAGYIFVFSNGFNILLGTGSRYVTQGVDGFTLKKHLFYPDLDGTFGWIF